MAGLSRFDFYPRDWHLDTRDLSPAARGIYIDLIAAMYANGGSIPHEEKHLCRLCGCYWRSLRKLLDELISTGKIKIADGRLTNGRTTREIAKAQTRIEASSKGGRARAKILKAQNCFRTASGLAQEQTEIEEKQQLEVCPPSPSPPLTLGTNVPKAGKPAFSAPSGGLQKQVYDVGRPMIGGGQTTKLIAAHKGDLSATLCTLHLAATKSDAREYCAAIIHGQNEPETDWDAEYRRMGVSL